MIVQGSGLQNGNDEMLVVVLANKDEAEIIAKGASLLEPINNGELADLIENDWTDYLPSSDLVKATYGEDPIYAQCFGEKEITLLVLALFRLIYAFGRR